MTRDSSAWENAWEGLNEFFVLVVDDLRQCNPQLWADIGHHEGGTFVFNAYVSIGRSSPGQEDLVLNWTVQRSAEAMSVAADISRGDGTVLAEEPIKRLTEPLDDPTVVATRDDAVTFFRKHMDLMRRELCGL